MIAFFVGLVIGVVLGGVSWLFIAAMFESARGRDRETEIAWTIQEKQGREGSRGRHPPQVGQ